MTKRRVLGTIRGSPSSADMIAAAAGHHPSRLGAAATVEDTTPSDQGHLDPF